MNFLQSIFQAVKGVLIKMGLVKQVQDVFKIKQIPMLDSFYTEYINTWKQIYRGFYEQWHDLKYKTVSGDKKRRMATMNAAKALCAELAGLTFNEQCEIAATDTGGTLQEYIDKVLADNSFFGQMQNLIEQAYALGGAVIKVWFENSRVTLDYVTADYFIPVCWDNKQVTDGIFVHKIVKESAYFTMLEWHLWEDKSYVIRNELYKSDNKNTLGTTVQLSTLYPDLEPEIRIEGLKHSLFVYFKPNIANNIEDNSPLGISIFANALDTLKALDVCFDSFMREFILGKKRIIVPSTAIRTVVDINGEMRRYFDANDEVYQALAFENPQDMKVQDNTVELRIEEHINSLNAFLSILALQTGLTPGTLAFNMTQGVKTATEVISENSKTFKTIKSHENIISEAIYNLIDIIVEVSQLYDVLPPTLEYNKSVTFDDSIVEDKQAKLALALQLVASGLRSKYSSLIKDFGYTEEDAVKELKRIQEENKIITGETLDFFSTE